MVSHFFFFLARRDSVASASILRATAIKYDY